MRDHLTSARLKWIFLTLYAIYWLIRYVVLPELYNNYYNYYKPKPRSLRQEESSLPDETDQWL